MTINKKTLAVPVVALLLLGVGFLSSAQAQPKDAQRVILISIDGARADFVRDLDLPNLHSVAKKGSYTYSARTILPSQTLPAHTSMFTGYAPEKHRTRTNAWKRGKYVRKPTIFDRLRAEGLTVKLMAAKEKFFHFKKPNSAFEVEIIEEGSRFMMRRVLETLSLRDYEFLFIHFKDPDQAGHDFGHESPLYEKAIKDVDVYIGLILSELKRTGRLDETTIIITSDHGMRGNSHGLDTPEEMMIPWLIIGPDIKEGHEIMEPVSIMDTAAVVLKLFNAPIPPDLDGKVIQSIFKAEGSVFDFNDPLTIWKTAFYLALRPLEMRL